MSDQPKDTTPDRHQNDFGRCKAKVAEHPAWIAHVESESLAWMLKAVELEGGVAAGGDRGG
jgi:hypothetical protein